MRRPRSPAARRGSLRGSPAVRLQIGLLLITMVLSVFAARLVQLQGVDPRSYAQMAAAEGQVTVVLPAERGEILDRNGEPLADSVEGLMVVADPALTSARAPEIAKFLAGRLGVDYIRTLDRLRAEDSRFQYIARQVPASLAQTVVDAAVAKGFEGLDTRGDPVRVYPARDVAANLVGFLGTPSNRGAAEPLAGLRGDVQQVPRRHRRRGDLPGRQRQPDPAGRRDADQGRRRQRPDHDPRPRPAVVHPAGARPDRAPVRRRVGVRRGDGQPHGRGADARRRADLRRQQPAGVARGAVQVGGAQRGLRARVGGEGAHDELAARRGPGHAVHPADDPAAADASGPTDRRLVRPRHDQADAHRGAGQVVQHRHGQGRRRVQATASCAATSRPSVSAPAPASG